MDDSENIIAGDFDSGNFLQVNLSQIVSLLSQKKATNKMVRDLVAPTESDTSEAGGMQSRRIPKRKCHWMDRDILSLLGGCASVATKKRMS